MENHGMFERYLSGEMNLSERSDFIQLLLSDPRTEKEFRVWAVIDENIAMHQKREEFRKTLNEVSGEYFDPRKPGKNTNRSSFFTKNWMKVAASLAVLAVIGTIMYVTFLVSPSDNDLYSEYYFPLKTDVITRSVNAEYDIKQMAYILYQKGDYKKCIDHINTNFSSDSIGTPLRIILGLSYMGINDFVNAERTLKTASADTGNLMTEDCIWYLSLCYLKQGQRDKCREQLELLISAQTSYAKKSGELLRELE